MKTLTYAPDAFKRLSGFFCLYKPSGLHYLGVRKMIAFNLCRDLNEMDVRPVRDYVNIEGSVVSGKPFTVSVVPNFADHPLVVGPRYQDQDIRLKCVSNPGKEMCGVMVMAINNACWKAREFHDKNPLQLIEVKGEFGYATDTFMHDGKVIAKSTYEKIRRVWLDRTISSIQASQQASAFNFSEIPIESQEAYEIASRGVIRPSGKCPTILYDIHCTEFNLPHFTLRMQCISPTVEYIAGLINEIGIYLRSNAVCHQIRCLRYGHFILEHALLRKHWTLEHILANIVLCKDISDPELWNKDNERLKPISKSDRRTSISFRSRQRLNAIIFRTPR